MTLTGNHIGTLIKPHGYKGEMQLRGKPLFLENLKTGTPLFIEIDELRVPFFIEELRLDPSNERCIIKFEFINSDQDAKKYADCQVYEAINAPILPSGKSETTIRNTSKSAKNSKRKTDSRYPGNSIKNLNSDLKQTQGRISLHISEYVGYTAIDTNTNSEYKITNYIDNAHNPLLVLNHNKEEILLPLNADYITETDTKNRVLKVSFPDGLL